MITNEELIEELKKFPKNLPVAIAVKYEDLVSFFYDINVQCAKSDDLRVVIVNSKNVDEEYETLVCGGEIEKGEDNS